jgi:hypothetical protein
MRKLPDLVVGLAVLILLMPLGTAKAAQTVYVSGTGSGNSCTRAAPCSFDTGIGALDSDEVLSCIDAAQPNPAVTRGFQGSGTFTIDCPGTVWTTPVNSSTLLLTGTGLTFIIRNMTFDGEQTGQTAITVQSGVILILQNCVFQNFNAGTGFPIAFTPTGPGALIIKDSVFQNNGVGGGVGGAISIAPSGGGGSARVVIERTQIVKNTSGIVANSGNGGMVLAEIKDSTVAYNANDGIQALAGGTTASIVLNHSTSDHNGGSGANAQGAGAYVSLINSTVLWNATGLTASGGGLILSYQNNVIAGNPHPGVTPMSVSQQ